MKTELLKDGSVSTSAIQTFEGSVVFSQSDSQGFYYFIVDTPADISKEVSNTVQLWHNDGTNSSKIYTFNGINQQVAPLRIINEKIVFILPEYVESDFQFDTGTGYPIMVHKVKIYSMGSNDLPPTELSDIADYVFGHQNNSNIILLTNPDLHTDFAWLYNLDTNVKTPILQK